MIPDWMKEIEPVPRAFPPAPKGKKSFIWKTLDGILNFFQESFVTEGFSCRPGLMQSIDPRAKLISVLALVIALSLTRDLRVIAVIYALELLISYASKVEVAFFIKRVWLFIPLFTGVIALPMTLNIFLPGQMLYQIIDLGAGAHLGPIALPSSIYFTREGVLGAAVFTARVAASVSAVVLLFLTTPQQLLFKSLRSVGVPKLYVLTTEMAYRYIFLLLNLIREMHVAKKARTIAAGSTYEEQKWVGGSIGYLLLRSLNMSERVHMAMVSRGFNGDVKIMQDFKMKGRDYVASVASISLSLVLVFISVWGA
jgi:cobalt/nickel transport system permease protein